jgi:enamine deaminase RidA (YjgF/YER057c/UK114 family)
MIQRRPDTTPTEHSASAPWLESVAVPPGTHLLFVSGQVPPIVDRAYPIEARRAYGDMEQQAFGVLDRLQTKLSNAGYERSDVVKLTVFLVGEAAFGGRPDLAGFDRAYRHFFAPPTLHARSRIQVVALMNPAWLVEIEAVAAREGAGR